MELRESADVLEKPGQKLAVLRDMKQFAGNIFEKLIGNSDRFGQYLSQLGRTRSAIQQTELSHFTPRPRKPKARFMNLGPTLRWGQMIWHHLSECHSQSRQGITDTIAGNEGDDVLTGLASEIDEAFTLSTAILISLDAL